MRTRRVIRWIALGVAGVAALAVICVFFWLLSGQFPNAESRRLEAIYLGRVAPADADNGYLDLYGFSAPADFDAHTRGAERVDWARRRRNNEEGAGKDPGAETLDYSKASTAIAKRINMACRGNLARACAEAVKSVRDGVPLSAHEDLLGARYRAMLGRGAWHEPLTFSASDPMPAYAMPFEAQQHMLLRMRQGILRGDTAGVREALQSDLVFWRRMLECSDTLISKMIAVSSIRNHFNFANLALRELPAEQARALAPPSWFEPITDAERSMWRSLAGEHVSMRNSVRNYPMLDTNLLDEEERPGALESLLTYAHLQVDGPRQLNELARVLVKVADDFSAPLNQYPRVRDDLVRGSDLPADAMRTWTTYAFRAASVEGMRRLALLALDLRARGVAPHAVAAELQSATLRDPFNGAPFTWNAEDGSVIFAGPQPSRFSLVLFY
jgi:hypothetical protein